jgi:DNA invertase Pin-like site-specific DNA recombinase
MTRDQIKRVVGYVRVSTTEQGDFGVSLEAQREAIEVECKRRGWELVEVYQDVASAKTLNGRHELLRALADMAGGKADGLLVTKLDRLSRSLLDFAGLVDLAKRQGWALIVLSGDFDMSTPAGRAMANMLAVFAEYEREMISQRTKEAMAAVKARGPKDGKLAIGRPKKIGLALEARIARMRRRGWSFQKIADKLTHDGVPTPTGKDAWSHTTVALVCKRLGLEPVRTRARRP